MNILKKQNLPVEEYSLASSMMKKTRRLISVGSGFKTNSLRASQSRKLLNWGLTNSVTFEVSKKDETIFKIKTWLGKNKTISGHTKKDVYITIAKKNLRNFNTFIEYTGPVKAPIKINTEIALIKVYQKDELIESIPIYATEEVKKINFILSLLTSFNYMIWGDA